VDTLLERLRFMQGATAKRRTQSRVPQAFMPTRLHKNGAQPPLAPRRRQKLGADRQTPAPQLKSRCLPVIEESARMERYRAGAAEKVGAMWRLEMQP
jgi:hypothetical protein